MQPPRSVSPKEPEGVERDSAGSKVPFVDSNVLSWSPQIAAAVVHSAYVPIQLTSRTGDSAL
jgi:hypothetical protein